MNKSIEKKIDHRLFRVLLGPVVSEKATMVADANGQIMFNVVPDADKFEVKAAVELLFKVKVESVQMLVRKGKKKRFGRYLGVRNQQKRAYVKLEKGQEISFGEGY